MEKIFVTDLSKVHGAVKGRLTEEEKIKVIERMNYWANSICYAEEDEISKVIAKALSYMKQTRYNSLISSLSYKERNKLYYHYDYNRYAENEITTKVIPQKNSKDILMIVKGFYGWKPHKLSSDLFFDCLFRIAIKELGIK